MYRVAGRRAGAAVLVGDFLKGFIPTAIGFGAGGRALAAACGLAAVIGHIFPAGRGFRGGKGVATLGGACCFLYPLVALCLLAVWAVTLKLFRTASVGSLTMAVLLPIGVALRGRPAWEVTLMAAASTLIIVRHWSNIKRIARNQEHALP